MTEKRFNVFDVDGTIFLEDHKEGSYHIGEIGNVDVNCLNDIAYRLNELAEENEKLKREYESLNSQLIRLDKELFCQDCFTCRHSKSINIDVECAEGEKKYHDYCDFYEISEEWVE